MRSEKVSQWRQPSSFLTHQGREDAAYQTEKNSYANILGHNTGHYILVHAHNSVHAEPFRRCLSIVSSSTCTKCSTLLDIISSFLLTLPGLMVSSIAPQEAFLDGYSRTYCSKLAISKLMLLMELAIITTYFPTQTPKSLQRQNDISYPDIPAYSHKQTSKLRYNLVRQFPYKWELFHLQQLEKPVNVAEKVFFNERKVLEMKKS